VPLTIYKSSAGSGKTFTLVKEYLKLVLRRPKDFQHILAITFTNKATEEMKSRVLLNLQQIAKGEASDIFEVLKSEFEGELNEALLMHRANEAYELIIHNYSRFEISTIDSFFSRVVRSFSRELDIPMSYELEMNTGLALEEAVNELFRSLSSNKDLRIWLEQFTFSQIENDKSWNIEGNILELGKNLFQEQFQDGFSQVDITLDRLSELVDELKKVIRLYEKGLKDLAQQAINLIEQNGLSVGDFSYGASGAANTFFKIKKGNYELGTRFVKAASGEQSWAKKKSDKEALIEQMVNGAFGEVASNVLAYVEGHERNYRTALALFRNIYAFGLLEALNSNLKQYRDEQNIMLISDNNALIREIVKEDDAPFLYEKIGSFFKHILIDEFQDTSNFQWNNLLPLILNSLSNDNQVLIVGDVKQSIYRFRGGNMRLLLEQIDKDLSGFEEVISYKNLTDNFRSLKEIVEFNNGFFDLLSKSLDRIEHVNDTEFIKRAYDGHQQNVKKANGGHVQVQLFKPDENKEHHWREAALAHLAISIKENIALGYDFKDILVLVNKNKEMPEIAAFLLAADIPFVSERSLMLKNNVLVRFMIEVLMFFQSQEDAIGLVNLAFLYNQLKQNEKQEFFYKRAEDVEDLKAFGLPDAFINQRLALAQVPLFDLIEQLLLIFDFRSDSDVFIQKFQDLVLEQTQKGVHSIHGFLEWWEEQGIESTISGNENANAVRILSVHKSKGLESPIVIMPFADYSFLPNPTLHSFWTKEIPEYLSDLSFVPLNYSKKNLINTDFEAAFVEETLESVLDALNKTYVAFTRAKEKLYIFGPFQQPRNEASYHRINHFLVDLLSDEVLGLLINDNSNILKYETKNIQLNQTIDKKTGGEEVKQIATYPNASYTNHLSIRSDSDRFFMLQGTDDAKNINLGNQVHEVLSLMTGPKDFESVLNQLLLEGTVSSSDLTIIKKRIVALMENVQLKQWFDSDFEVLAERELWYDDKIIKPDRVMTKGNEAIVVDYKKEKASEAQHNQVRGYMKAMRDLGFSTVTGFLVYVDTVEIEEVVL
jgi:ATP-dependent helicase/nuclease subunit A